MTEKRGRGRPPKPETVVARQAVAQFQQAQHPTPYQQATIVMRNKLAAFNRAGYDVAGSGRFLSEWRPSSSGPNTSQDRLQVIKDRSRDANRNEWASTTTTQKWGTTLIGFGITPRFDRLTNETRKLAVTDLFNDFVKESDADCVVNYFGQQTMVVYGWFESGEIFARRRDRPFDDELAVPMQVQLLESDMCPDFNADTFDKLPESNRIVRGIEINKRGKRVAYWFYKEHPSDGKWGPNSMSTPSADTLVRVLASEVCHIFKPTRPGQMRGVPALAPALARLRSIANYDGNVLTRMQLSNMFMAWVKQTIPEMLPDDSINGPVGIGGEMPTGQLPGGTATVGMQPGATAYLGPGEEVVFSNPPEAGPDYPAYMRTQHLGTAAATGIPYELFSGDIVNVSDRTLRVVINEFRRLAEQHQWQVVIPMFCEKVLKWFADAAVIAGKISIEEADAVVRAKHQPQGWAYIHPVQDPQGKKIEVDAGFRSRSSVIAERGDDPGQVDIERQADDEREQDMEIGAYSAAAALENAPAAGAAGGANEPQDEPVEPATNDLNLKLSLRTDEEIKLLRAQVARLEKPPKPAEDPMAATRAALMSRVLTLLEPIGPVQ